MSNTSTPADLAEWSSYVTRAQGATCADEIAALYVGMIGYDPRDDEPSISFEEMRDICTDYVRELCYAFEVHVSQVGL